MPDNLSCRSSPMLWNPKPVPAPTFDLELSPEVHLTWEHCTNILNGRSTGNSHSQRHRCPWPVFGGASSEYSFYASSVPPVKVEEVEDKDDFSLNDLELQLPQQQESGSALRKRLRFLRGILGKKSSRVGLPHRKSPNRLSPSRLSSAELGIESDPRVSSANVANMTSTAATEDFASVASRKSKSMNRWLQHQQHQALVDKAQGHLDSLQYMLNCVAKSLDESRELDHYAEEMHQKQTRRYFAT